VEETFVEKTEDLESEQAAESGVDINWTATCHVVLACAAVQFGKCLDDSFLLLRIRLSPQS
jgi:hypothetical protein